MATENPPELDPKELKARVNNSRAILLDVADELHGNLGDVRIADEIRASIINTRNAVNKAYQIHRSYDFPEDD